MPAEETHITAYSAPEHKKTSPDVLNLVKPTALEELCRRVADRNIIRDFWIWVLAKIMTAYSYMRCELNAEHITISTSDINCLKNLARVDSSAFLYDWDHESYFHAQIIADLLSRFSIPAGRYQDFFSNIDQLLKKLRPLAQTTLRETLWDPEKREISPEKLKEYIAKYTWAFPPNTLELLEEMTASPEVRREFEKDSGEKLVKSDLTETECGLVETI